MTPQDFLFAILGSLADIRTALNYLVASVGLIPVAILAHAFITRGKK